MISETKYTREKRPFASSTCPQNQEGEPYIKVRDVGLNDLSSASVQVVCTQKYFPPRLAGGSVQNNTRCWNTIEGGWEVTSYIITRITSDFILRDSLVPVQERFS